VRNPKASKNMIKPLKACKNMINAVDMVDG